MRTCVIATYFKTRMQAEKELLKRANWKATFSILEMGNGYYIVSANARKKLGYNS